MRGRLLARAASAVLVLAVAAPASAQRSFQWWRAEEVQKDLGLTQDQVTRLDDVFQTAMDRQRKNKDVLDRLEAQLSTLIEQGTPEADVVKQIDKVEAARATLNKERTLMLLHMRQVLTPEQRATYNARVEQWQKDHPRPSRQDSNRGSGRSQR
jgi:Spy/CpxP family protein refolding chaperone